MKVYGKNGLGSILKGILEISFVLLIIAVIIVTFLVPKVIVFYPNIVCFLIIMYAFIGLFDVLEKEEPFCKKTIKKMKLVEIASGICSIIWLAQLIYEIVLAKEMDILFNMGLLFMAVLFFGVSIAMYILKALFVKANNYKEENDLTI